MTGEEPRFLAPGVQKERVAGARGASREVVIRRRPGTFGVLALLAFLSGAGRGTLPAQEPPRADPQQEEPALTWDVSPQIEHYDPKTGVLSLIGGVHVRIRDLEIRCENLVAWVGREEARRSPAPEPEVPLAGERTQEAAERLQRFVQEIYAEGMVIFRQGDEWIRAEAVFLDLVNERGIVVDATAELPLRNGDREIPLVVRAQELRLTARNRVEAVGVRLTTCAFGHPHYHLASDSVAIVKERVAVPPELAGQVPPLENYHLEVQGNVLHLGELPVLWLPDFVGDTAARRSFQYVEDVRYRNSSRFGHEIGITLGDDIVAGEGQLWGHWSIPIDWYSKRGPGIGVDIVYARPGGDYTGTLITRYQRDDGRDPFFGDPSTKNRGRISWIHRHHLPGEVQLDLELQLFSDRGYYPTFFEDDDKTLKPPENLIYLKRAFFNSYVTALFSKRLNNDWETVTEYKPELRYDLVYEPLLDLFDRPLYFDATARISRNRLRIDEDLDLPGGRSFRADVDTLLEYPFPVGPLIVTPFAGLRYTFYEEDLFGRENRDRIGFTHGATLALQSWRVFDVSGGLLGLDGLRHVVYPELTFRNTVGVDVPPEDLIPFDEVDTFDNVQVFELSVRNLLQTIRHRALGPEVENLVDLETSIAFFPNADRDNRGREVGNLEVDLIFRPSDDLQFATDFEVSFYDEPFEVANAAVGYTPSPDFQLYMGFRHFEDTYDAAFAQLNWRVDEKWLISAETAYDFFEDRGLDHRLVFSRIGHDWVLQFAFRADIGEEDYAFTVSIEPRILFDPVLHPRGLRSEPRLLYLGTGLRN